MTSLRHFLARAERKLVLDEQDPAADLLRRGILDRVDRGILDRVDRTDAIEAPAHHTGADDRDGRDLDGRDLDGRDAVEPLIDFVTFRLLAFGAGDETTTRVREAVAPVLRAGLGVDDQAVAVLDAVDLALEPAGLAVGLVHRADGGALFGLTVRTRSAVADWGRRAPASSGAGRD